jgi:hypothetical protein
VAFSTCHWRRVGSMLSTQHFWGILWISRFNRPRQWQITAPMQLHPPLPFPLCASAPLREFSPSGAAVPSAMPQWAFRATSSWSLSEKAPSKARPRNVHDDAASTSTSTGTQGGRTVGSLSRSKPKSKSGSIPALVGTWLSEHRNNTVAAPGVSCLDPIASPNLLRH